MQSVTEKAIKIAYNKQLDERERERIYLYATKLSDRCHISVNDAIDVIGKVGMVLADPSLKPAED